MMNDNRNQGGPVQYRPVAVGMIALMTIALAVAGILLPRAGEAPSEEDPVAQVRTDEANRLVEGCAVVQQLTYSRCGHGITRRLVLPTELVGKARADAEAAYEGYRITSYASDEIAMAQTMDMYCADHLVMMADEAGTLCVFENKYGDAYALVQETEVQLSALPSAYQEELLPGKAFDTLEEVERYLESIES